MGLDATICIGTFGGVEWVELAERRAIPSAKAQGVPVIHRHAPTLARARNDALSLVETEWVVFLDADDELDQSYLNALGAGSADLRAPSVCYVRAGHRARPRVPRVAGHAHACTADCLTQGNWLVVGTAVRTQLIRDVGGWEEWPWSEDWAVWLKCHLAGASIEAIPEAVYIAHWSRSSRNRAPGREFTNRVHGEILAALLPAAVAA